MSRMLTEDVTENFERMKEAFRMFDKVMTKSIDTFFLPKLKKTNIDIK